MPRPKRLDAYRRTEVNLSAETRELLQKLAADMAEGKGRPVPLGEVIERAVLRLAKQLKIE